MCLEHAKKYQIYIYKFCFKVINIFKFFEVWSLLSEHLDNMWYRQVYEFNQWLWIHNSVIKTFKNIFKFYNRYLKLASKAMKQFIKKYAQGTIISYNLYILLLLSKPKGLFFSFQLMTCYILIYIREIFFQLTKIFW